MQSVIQELLHASNAPNIFPAQTYFFYTCGLWRGGKDSEEQPCEIK